MADIGPRGAALIRWMIAFTAICIVVLLLRLWAARVVRRSFFLDDCFIIISFASIITFEGVVIWGIANGAGKRAAELSPSELATQAKILVLPSSIAWLIGTVAIKLSVIWLYVRIFSTQAFQRWAYALMAAVACYGVAFMAVFMTICQPIDQLWNPVPGGHCRDTSIQEYTSVAFNLVLDLCIFLLPMPCLWGLQMPLRNKIAISVMFGIGFVLVYIQEERVRTLLTVSSTIGVMCWRIQATKLSVDDPDASYWLTDLSLISLLELWLGLIVASIPTLAPLLRTYITPAISKMRSGSSSWRFTPREISLNNIKDSQTSRQYYALDPRQETPDGHHLVPGALNTGVAFATECSHDAATHRADPRQGPDSIHVQQEHYITQ